MGTFDSVYKNKIRQLEEENRKLRKLIENEDWPLYPESTPWSRQNPKFDPWDPIGLWRDYYFRPAPQKPSHWGQPNPNDPGGPPLGYGPEGSGNQVNPLGTNPTISPGVITRGGGGGGGGGGMVI